MATWIKDANGNQCSFEYWGSEEKAREALSSLTRCFECFECSDLSDCYGYSCCSGLMADMERLAEVPAQKEGQ